MADQVSAQASAGTKRDGPGARGAALRRFATRETSDVEMLRWEIKQLQDELAEREDVVAKALARAGAADAEDARAHPEWAEMQAIRADPRQLPLLP